MHALSSPPRMTYGMSTTLCRCCSAHHSFLAAVSISVQLSTDWPTCNLLNALAGQCRTQLQIFDLCPVPVLAHHQLCVPCRAVAAVPSLNLCCKARTSQTQSSRRSCIPQPLPAARLVRLALLAMIRKPCFGSATIRLPAWM